MENLTFVLFLDLAKFKVSKSEEPGAGGSCEGLDVEDSENG